ncbi:hypothetical protein FGO68_gene13308 [Halteria grandinella]|uniref:Uncharacterized protein n=1 Tax=Halteria grandinella TaxID=5974 RepID=A0A8J8SW75_HALGN|nr:hypothetical protein FGO68_gene13308 [Halteria grandinella]
MEIPENQDTNYGFGLGQLCLSVLRYFTYEGEIKLVNTFEVTGLLDILKKNQFYQILYFLEALKCAKGIKSHLMLLKHPKVIKFRIRYFEVSFIVQQQSIEIIFINNEPRQKSQN